MLELESEFKECVDRIDRVDTKYAAAMEAVKDMLMALQCRIELLEHRLNG